ncbi:MAG: glycosyltransferase [Acidobacteriota bacterium]|nr:glycosyltransferase [Acidobacteriota bacterium]
MTHARVGSGPIRVLRVIARLNVGGPARHVALVTAGLDPTRFSSWLVTGSENPGEGSLEPYVHAHGVEPLSVPEMVGQATISPRDAIALVKLIRVTRQIRPHIVHTHTAKAGFLGRVAARMSRVPIVVHTYHGHVLSGYYGPGRVFALRQMERGLACLTDRLIAVSERVREDLVSLRIAPRRRFAVVPLGLELDQLAAATNHRGVLRGELGLSRETKLVGIVGRLFPIKNHGLLLDAMARLATAREGIRLVVVGDGILRATLEERARRPDLSGKVFFTGWRFDLPEIYADLDVLAVSSRNEGTPVSAIEAMAAGCPVVATRVGGLPDVIADGRTGTLVPPDDAPALAAAIGRVLDDWVRTDRLRREAQADVRRRYSVSRLVADLQRLYVELLTAKRVLTV